MSYLESLTNYKGSLKIVDFASVEEFGRASDALRLEAFSAGRSVNANGDEFWDDVMYTGRFGGSDSWTELVRKTQDGDESQVRYAMEMLDKLDMAIETHQRTYVPSPFGAYPVVPEFLADNPEPMRRLEPQTSDFAPLTIWLYVGTSGAITPKQLLDRGTAVLALVLKLQQTRAVDLKICDGDLSNGRYVININTRPLVLATAAYALSSPGMHRRLGYNVLPGGGGCGLISDASRMRLMLPEAQPQDIMIPGVIYSDNDQLINNPIDWIKHELRKALGKDSVELA